jgi:predicted dehydrogenase
MAETGMFTTAVIGCGGISHQHLEPLVHLSNAGSLRLEAVCDRSSALADLARDRYGAAQAFTDADDMLSTVRPDIVHVLTPPNTHVDLATRALRAGAHVICEKPLAPSFAETQAVLDTAAGQQRAVIETRNYLYNDGVIELDRRIVEGQIGDVREIEAALSLDLAEGALVDAGLRLPGGAAHDFLPHLASLFVHFAEHIDEVDEVCGRVDNLSAKPTVGIDHVDVLVSAGGRRGRLKISPDVAPDSFRIYLRGTRGSLEADLFQPYLRHEGAPFVGKRAALGHIVGGVNLAAAGFRSAKDKLLQHDTYHGVARMLGTVYTALADGSPLPIRPPHMLASARLVDQILALADDHPSQVDRQPDATPVGVAS